MSGARVDPNFGSSPRSVGLAGQGLASDSRSIDGLRAAAARDPRTAIKETAKQFEALFMQELLKSMRSATLSSGMLENSGTALGTEMLDTQYSAKLSGMRGGLADAIAAQLERQMGGALIAPKPAAGPDGAAVAAPLPTLSHKDVPVKVQRFIQQHDAAAKVVSAQTGIPASFMIAQAAHETGWGRQQITNKDGSSANNLFGIKAGASWTGQVAEVQTTEYIDGKPQKVMARFRAYASAEESFRDYAALLTSNSRYSKVVASVGNAEGFARGLQQAGYATDPAYAEKLTKVINTTLRMQRLLAV